MANHDNNNEIKEGFVDISSNKQVNKIYKKRADHNRWFVLFL